MPQWCTASVVAQVPLNFLPSTGVGVDTRRVFGTAFRHDTRRPARTAIVQQDCEAHGAMPDDVRPARLRKLR